MLSFVSSRIVALNLTCSVASFDAKINTTFAIYLDKEVISLQRNPKHPPIIINQHSIKSKLTKGHNHAPHHQSRSSIHTHPPTHRQPLHRTITHRIRLLQNHVIKSIRPDNNTDGLLFRQLRRNSSYARSQAANNPRPRRSLASDGRRQRTRATIPLQDI